MDNLEHPSDTATPDLTSDDAFTQRLNQLVDEAKAHRSADLAFKLKVGKLLNERFGSPAEAPEEGDQAVLKTASKRLGHSESELCRMQWFGHLYQSVEDLNERYPKAASWQAVKAVLPQLPRQQGAPEVGGDPSTNPLEPAGETSPGDTAG